MGGDDNKNAGINTNFNFCVNIETFFSKTQDQASPKMKTTALILIFHCNYYFQEQERVEAVEVAVVEEEVLAEEGVVAVEEVGEVDSLAEAKMGAAEEAGVEAEGVSTRGHSQYLINSDLSIILCVCCEM